MSEGQTAPVLCRVGDQVMLVPFETLMQAFNEVQEYFCDVQGLHGPPLDSAICHALPYRLEEIVNGGSIIKH
jgi:hypothetical protein